MYVTMFNLILDVGSSKIQMEKLWDELILRSDCYYISYGVFCEINLMFHTIIFNLFYCGGK